MSISFDGRPGNEIAQSMATLVSKEQTEAQFAALASQDAKTRDFVIGHLEKDILSLAGQFREAIEDAGMARARKAFMSTSAPDTQAALNEEQSLIELVRQVAAQKGDAATPLLKTIAQEIAALPAGQPLPENAVYGALFDALERTMTADGSMAKVEDALRLEKIHDAFGWRITVGVKEHFNNVGKFQEFADAATPADNAEQKAAMRGLLLKPDAEATIGALTATDIFMRVARRVGTDEELAKILPAGKFDAKDVEVLEKNNLTSLAALVKTAIGNKPK